MHNLINNKINNKEAEKKLETKAKDAKANASKEEADKKKEAAGRVNNSIYIFSLSFFLTIDLPERNINDPLLRVAYPFE